VVRLLLIEADGLFLAVSKEVSLDNRKDDEANEDEELVD
jgi:hypothetical protein